MGRGAPRRSRTQAVPARPGLGDRLRDARLRAGLSQEQLAGNDYSRAYVSGVESGRIRPTLQALEYLSSKVSSSAVALAGLAGEAPEPIAALGQCLALIRGAQGRADSVVQREALRAAELVLSAALRALHEELVAATA